MTPVFDSESDRRDFLRRETLRKCVDQFYDTIKMEGVTRGVAEKRWFVVAMARELLKTHQMDMQMSLYAEEIRDAETKL